MIESKSVRVAGHVALCGTSEIHGNVQSGNVKEKTTWETRQK
jgi:hypothetical protein